MEILLVDDNEIILGIQKAMLESCGLSVTTVCSGEDAVEIAQTHNFFMIFMDINMGGIDGFEAAYRIRAFNDTVPIIALSADDISASDEGFVKSRMNAGLKKPLDIGALRELLNQYSDLVTVGMEQISVQNDSVFDFQELVSVLGSEELVLDVLQQFINVHMQDCQWLKVNVEKGNFLAGRKVLHDIIGVSGNLCCGQLYNAALVLSSELKRERSDSMENFAQVWKRTVDELQECIDQLAPVYKTAGDNVDFADLWQEFKGLCFDFDTAAHSLFIKNMDTFGAYIAEEDFSKLKRAIDSYDFLWMIDHMEELDVQGIAG